ncbi:HNH endonuclease family protein [Streptomyces sp. NPDC058335]|uniref:HNH endonuclease family protein n=1 Tax=Streptomyces sp. NPDC058335 TaxID=3346451 RepID=UPI0036614EBF
MIKTLARSAAAFLLSLPLGAAGMTPAAADEPAVVVLPLAEAVQALPVAAETREGYQRTRFKHWIDADHDSCSTRAEVLIAESRIEPVIEAGCKVTAGLWFSYYDGATLTDPRGLDIDHMVPLAEAWDSGAAQWTPARREAYANDLDADRSLVAVTARTNRSKADQDPAQWLPPLTDARCTYAADWVATKLRWRLAVDEPERQVLGELSAGCGRQTLEYTPAP